MDRAWLEQQLADVERHVALGRDHIARQRQIVLDFELAGYDTATAQALLQTFEGMQKFHEAHAERLTEILTRYS